LLQKSPDLTWRRSILPVIILSGLIFRAGSGQDLSGTINHFAAVEFIYATDNNDVDSVRVASLPAAFGEGDTVMLYVVRGSEILATEDENAGDIDKIELNPGKYAFMIIQEIAGNIVIFNTTTLPEIRPLQTGEVAQLIRVPSYRKAEVVGTVTAPAWNDVTGKGFRGAVENRDYNMFCSSTDTALYDSAFYYVDHAQIKAGKKGEGITDTLFDRTRGRARNIIGGGGGNGRLSGGGGGSNYSSGGKGGDEAGDCGPGVQSPGGGGGLPLYRFSVSYYLNYDEVLPIYWVLNRWNRIFFGGGGGTGTRVAGRNTTAGGNGGGLVVIVADTIEANGGRIIANGASVTTNATGAGGGGGGGGGIILDVSGYKNNVQLSAVGGNGGNTNYSSVISGPGGGGGGGIYWLAGTNEPGVSPDLVSKGKNGIYVPTANRHGALDGLAAARKNGLEAPLRGFLFNSVPSEFRVCSDQVPETILASKPKGGDGTYHYQWVDSSATQHNWLPVGPADTLQHLYFSAPLADTTYYRRIVTSSVLPPDTSFRIAVYVHRAVTNNTVSAPDTVCSGGVPVPFVSVGSPGGGLGAGSYTYTWVDSSGTQNNWQPAPGTRTNPGYSPPALSETTWYSRITRSGVCADTSSPLRVTVLEILTGNNITSNDTICRNTRPDLITGPVAGGGDPGDLRYMWESSLTGSAPWTDEGVDTREYQPGPLAVTTWYRRVALSGSDDACVDQSDPVVILNIDPVTSNSIVTGDQSVCTNVQPVILQGSMPGGGYQGTYSYRWESRTISTGWVDADDSYGNKNRNYQPPVMTGDSTWFRRVVGSGGKDLEVCTDISDSVAVHVLPLITNNVIMTDDDVKCQFDVLGDLVQNPSGGTEPGGGATQPDGTDLTRNYKWERATGTGAPGANWTEISYGFDRIDYTDRPRLVSGDDYWYRRIVLSGPGLGGENQVCSDTSELIRITIHSQITGNLIEAFDSACFNSTKEVEGDLPSGESGLEPSYVWLDNLAGTELGGTEQNYSHLFDGQGPYEFRRVTTIGECTDTSNIKRITVMQLPGGILSADISRTCEKDTLFNIVLNMDTLTNFITPWVLYLDDGVNTSLDGPYYLDGSGPFQVTLETYDNQPSTQFNYIPGTLLYTSPTGRYECEAPRANLKGNVSIEVFNKPRPKITVEGVETSLDSICGSSLSLAVDPDHGTGFWTHDPFQYLSYAPDSAATEVVASIPESNEAWAIEKYVLTFYSEAGDCSGTDQIELHFFEQPEPAFAGKDTTIFLKNSLELNADPATAGIGTWTLVSGNGVFADEHDPKTFVYDLEKDGDNSFRWTVTNGNCSSSEHVSVVTQREVFRYEGFSPNGDGYNDVFIIRGLADATRFEITFFNNLGKTVRKVTQETAGEIHYDPTKIPGGLREDELVVWDGLATNGKTVPSGTYYYVVSMAIDQKDDKGNVLGTDRYEYKDYIVVRD
jgi:hypothetical protein